MSWGIVASVAAPVIGGLMGGQSSGGQQQSKQELDPRMQKILYGGDGDTGLLNDVNELRKKQLAQGGLNPMQTAGLEMQRQTLMDPRYTQGYDQMRQQGSSLMGQKVASNPFSGGYQGGTNFSPNLGMTGGANGSQPQGMPQMQQQPLYQQNSAMAGAMQPMSAPSANTAPAPQSQPTPSPMDDMLRQLAEERLAYQRTDGQGTRNYGGGR